MKINRNKSATLLGIVTSIVMALTLLDLDSMDFSKPNTWVKILALLMPTIGGAASSLNETKP